MLYYFPFQGGQGTLPTEDNPLLAQASTDPEPTQSEAVRGTQAQEPMQANGAIFDACSLLYQIPAVQWPS